MITNCRLRHPVLQEKLLRALLSSSCHYCEHPCSQQRHANPMQTGLRSHLNSLLFFCDGNIFFFSFSIFGGKRLSFRISGKCGPAGPVPLVLDLRVSHDRVGNSADTALNGHLRYPNNLDRCLNVDKIRRYRVDYNKNPPRCYPTDISVSPSNNRVVFPSPLLRQRA